MCAMPNHTDPFKRPDRVGYVRSGEFIGAIAQDGTHVMIGHTAASGVPGSLRITPDDVPHFLAVIRNVLCLPHADSSAECAKLRAELDAMESDLKLSLTDAERMAWLEVEPNRLQEAYWHVATNERQHMTARQAIDALRAKNERLR